MMARATCRSRLLGYGLLLYSVKRVITNLEATYTHTKKYVPCPSGLRYIAGHLCKAQQKHHQIAK